MQASPRRTSTAGAGRWSNSRLSVSTSLSQSSSPTPPLGDHILTLQLDDLLRERTLGGAPTTISECTHVASFNWLDADNPTILIPGAPAQWKPLREPHRLLQDSGKYFRDRNAARFPRHPLEPAVVAALSSSPQLNVDEHVDIVACASTFGNLARFARGEDKSFRMLADQVEGTIFLTRRENSPTELINDIWGYGHTFPEAYTTWHRDVKNSASHQRVIKYRFGGLTILLRYEADGCIEPDSKGPAKKIVPAVSGAESLAQSLETARISPTKPGSSQVLKIEKAGRLVAESTIFDLKTRSVKKANDDILGGELPRLWITQVPNFIVAFHKSGLFDDIRVMDARARVLEWEEDNAESLSTLTKLMHVLIEQVRKRADSKVELCQSTPGKLEIRERLPDAGDALSPDARQAWAARVLRRRQEEQGTVGDAVVEWDDEEGEGDLTACSDACGYCGRCA